MEIRQSSNQLLAALPPPDFDRLRPHLRTVEMKFGDVLIEAGARLDQVFFPHGGIVSRVIRLRRGDTIEVAMIGCDGVVGGCVLHETIAAAAAIVRYPGMASVIEATQFRRIAETSPELRGVIMRHQWLRAIKAEHTAACNAAHTAEARLCRRLLESRDMAGSDCMLLGQDLMAQMLGVKRNTISLIAHALQAEGLIRYSRGRLVILDPHGLMQRACECYGAERNCFDPIEALPAALVPPHAATVGELPQRMPS